MTMMNPTSAKKTAGNAEASLIPTPTSGDRSLGLYFHVPFCTKKCGYCHFFVLPDAPDQHSLYVAAIRKELALYQETLKSRPIYSIYFGGGTPSLLNPSAFEQILSDISYDPHIEITLEANPELLTLEKLRSFRALGINRLSIGAQSFDNHLLTLLGRTHKADETLKALDNAVRAGFENISIDLMYDLPEQTLTHWENTLAIAQSLPITHLSLYNLQIEEGTVFYKKRATLAKQMPDPDASLAMYLTARERLAEAGLNAYEISAFAKPGFYSRHNTSYWTARPFLGLGPSAFSYENGTRYKNCSHFGKYQSLLDQKILPNDFSETLPPDARIRELLAIELRLVQGIDPDAFQKRHGSFDTETIATLQSLSKKGWLTESQGRIRMSDQGILFYDSVASELI
jgi:oxygen-independent coproporphyrinogen-3 oxidase